MIVELKVDAAPETALTQIKERRYAGSLKGYSEEIILVGISYDKKTKQHSCVIEKLPGLS